MEKSYDFQIIANLMSGKGEAKNVIDNLVSFLKANNKTFDILRIEKPTPISKLPHSGNLINNGVICIGGDGTVAETIGYILNNKLNIPLAVIPTGTANFIADSFGIINYRNDFYFLLRKNLKTVDIGLAKYSPEIKYFFMLGTGIGFEEKFLKITKDKLKSRLGIISYILVALSELFSLKKININIKTEKEELNLNICTGMILNTQPKIFKIFPIIKNKNININNGQLHFQYVEYHNFLQAFFGVLILHVFGEVKINSIKSLERRQFFLTSQIPVGTQIDGELRNNLPVDISIMPSAFQFII